MSSRNPNYCSSDSRSQAPPGHSPDGRQMPLQNTGLVNEHASQSWLFSTPSASSIQSQATLQQSLASTFYGAEPTTAQQLQDVHARQYQDWIDAFNGHQPSDSRVSTQGLGTLVPQVPAQGPYSLNQQDQYSDPFPPFAPSTTGTVPPSSGRSPQPPSTSAYRPPEMDSYTPFYENMLNTGMSRGAPGNTGRHVQTPESTLHSYTGTPEPPFLNAQAQMPHQHPQNTFHNQGQFNVMEHPQIQHSQAAYQQQSSHQATSNRPVEYQQQFSRTSLHPLRSNRQSSNKSPPSRTGEAQQTSANSSPKHVQFMQHRISPPARTKAPTSSAQANARAPPASRPQVEPPLPSASTSSSPALNSTKRKRAKKDEQNTGYDGADSETESEDDEGNDGGISVGMGGFGVISKAGKNGKASRLPGACTHCKKLKMKCDFPRGADTCKRCRAGRHACIVEGRKPRTAPNKREYLLAQIRQKDQIIESLLKQLHNPYLATPLSIASYRMATSPSDQNKGNVLAWLDRLQSSVTDTGTGSLNHFKDAREVRRDDSDAESDSQGRTSDVEDADDRLDKSYADEKAGCTLPDIHVPLGLIAKLSLVNNKKNKKKGKEGKDLAGISEDDLNDDNVGIANETYFMPGPATDLGMRATLIEQHSPPEILVHGLVTPDDVEKLFDLFFKYINPFISLLDPVLHTPATTFARCPFLFTVVCAIASRFYTEKSEIYPIAMHFAKHSAATALIDGWKSVELCQAYILMSIYAVPARRWEEDRSWLYTGLAIRIATDLNLHQVSNLKASCEKQERENLNKTRVWMICYNLDLSTATQFGKPSTIKEDFIVRNGKEWYQQSMYNHPFDIHLCGYSALLQIVSKFHDQIFSDPSSPTRLNKNVDFRAVTLEHDVYLTEFHAELTKRFEEKCDKNDPGVVLRIKLLPFLVAYSRLVMFSFGFQQAYQRGLQPSDHIFFTKCLESAKSVIENMVEPLAESGYMKYAPDGHFVFATFASAFLLKLLRPEFSKLVSREEENDVFDLIGRLIQTLSSAKIAIDDRHTPKLYARFLASLLSRYRRDGATVGRLQTQPPPQQQIPAGNTRPAPGGSMTTFSLKGHGQASGSGVGTGFPQGGYPQQRPMDQDTPVYMPEATFAAGAGQISFGSGLEGSGGSEEMILAPMQALKNPAWWQDFLMPGFSWPEASPSGPTNSYVSNQACTSSYVPPCTMPGMAIGGSFGIFHSAAIPI